MMKIPDNMSSRVTGPGMVRSSMPVQDSGPTEGKSPVRPETPVSESSSQIAQLVETGQVTPAQAMELVIDGIVANSGTSDPAGMKDFLLSQMTTDPQLRLLAAQLGLDVHALETLAGVSAEVES